ncbi:hypothetical protein HOLleu_18601 [Holothuria leucospilota]|uniref:TIR domain-containing protein n=1 Tax=Holothuria leucospilota TaxID=206669 RepID=A0A9Q1H9K0_HOLLE|nr:hypothetical protein HOLleu_18601 [Holothuria leucospilota]
MVGDVFRCLVPILKNEDGSVVTPLLSTGDQGFERDVMMAGMIEAAVRWMKAGLPLRKLKIVLYASRVEGDAKAAAMCSKYRMALRVFEQMKEKYDMQYMMPKEVPLEFDIYLSYSEADKNIVDKIQEKLKKNKEDVHIFSTRQQLDENSFWQEDMYEVMMKSTKVIAGQ